MNINTNLYYFLLLILYLFVDPLFTKNAALFQTKQHGVKVRDLNVNCQLYADDAVLIESSECALQALVTTMKEGCENNGLNLNANKINVLVFDTNEERRNAISV